MPNDRRPEILRITTRASQFVPPAADRTLADGERLDIPGFDLRAMLTPGHTSGHLCLRDDERSVAPHSSTWQIAARLTWSAGWPKLVDFLLFSALAQTDMHRDYLLGTAR